MRSISNAASSTECRPVDERLGRGCGVALGGLVLRDHLQELQHRLVVLVLVGEDQVVDEAVTQDGLASLEVDLVEHVQRPLADLGHVGAQVVAAQDRQLVAGGTRVFDRVVKAAQLAAHRLPARDRLHQPELLEVRDVPEVPGERAEDLAVDGVELLVGQRLDEEQRAPARLLEAVRDRFLRSWRGRRRRDGITLDVSASDFVTGSHTNVTTLPRR